jgi:hypothetical protein
MTPYLYSRRLLEKIISKSSLRDLSLFHWTNKSSLLNIIREGKIYSKGTLWGLGKLTNELLSKKKTVKEDSEHGFVDFIFLGTKNWIADGRPSFYGGYAIEFSSQLLLEDTEFFVFHFNTGYKWPFMQNEDRVSDLSKLTTLNGKTGEVLIRRKIDINPNTIKKFHCPFDDASEIRAALESLDLSGNVETYDRMVNTDNKSSAKLMNIEYEIELEYGSFTDHKLKTIDSSQIRVEGNSVWIFDKDSPCVLDFIKSGDKLLDTIDHREVGKITIKQKLSI